MSPGAAPIVRANRAEKRLDRHGEQSEAARTKAVIASKARQSRLSGGSYFPTSQVIDLACGKPDCGFVYWVQAMGMARRSKAFCWRGVGRVRTVKGRLGAMAVTTVLRARVARSASRLWKLWTGRHRRFFRWPSWRRRVASAAPWRPDCRATPRRPPCRRRHRASGLAARAGSTPDSRRACTGTRGRGRDPPTSGRSGERADRRSSDSETRVPPCSDDL